MLRSSGKALDTVSTEHPILISRYCQHVHVANSLALENGWNRQDFRGRG